MSDASAIAHPTRDQRLEELVDRLDVNPGAPDKRPAADATNYDFVVDLAHRRFRFAMRTPCEGDFTEIAFP